MASETLNNLRTAFAAESKQVILDFFGNSAQFADQEAVASVVIPDSILLSRLSNVLFHELSQLNGGFEISGVIESTNEPGGTITIFQYESPPKGRICFGNNPIEMQNVIREVRGVLNPPQAQLTEERLLDTKAHLEYENQTAFNNVNELILGVQTASTVESVNTEVFESIWNQYHKLIFSIGFKILENAQDAEDVVQNIGIALYLKLPSLDTSYSLKYWLVRATEIESLNLRKNIRKKQGVDISQLDLDTTVFFAGNGLNSLPDRGLEDLNYLNVLPEKFREILDLHLIKNLSFEEIEKSYGIPHTTAHRWYTEALQELKIVLEHEMLL